MKDSYIFYTDQLSGEYKEAFGKIEMYVQSQNVDESAAEERLGELLDIFCSAQEKGKPILQVTGNNLEQFCKTFCSDFGIKNHMLRLMDWMKSFAWLLLIIALMDLLFPEQEIGGQGLSGILSIPISLNLFGYLMGMGAAGILGVTANALLRRMMFRRKWVSIRVLHIGVCVVVIVTFFVVWWFLDKEHMNFISCPAWTAAVAAIAYLLAYYRLCKKRIKRPKVKFSDLVQEEMRKDMDSEMAKKYQKARNRSQRRGKGDLAYEAFLEKERKNCDAIKKWKAYYYLLPLVIIAAAVFITFLLEGFDGPSDVMIFVGIQLVIQYLLMSWLWKVAYKGTLECKAWIEGRQKEARQKEIEE